LAASALARTGRYDAVVAIGAVIRGDTAHFDFVAGGAADGLLRVQLDTGVPVVFGVLTTENRRQALVRSTVDGDVEGDDKGAEAAEVAIEMVAVLRAIQAG
jgi:6,7-dimethyl-8-ribityllumazine synthase